MNQVKLDNNTKEAPLISVAPMMDWTDQHCRFFHRLISPNVFLYTEMVTTGAVIHGDKDRFLRFSAQEHPVALQLGGSNPKELAECAKIGEEFGYDEINLNCGCPSDRVQKGKIGACLMKEPDIVADCVSEMRANVNIPVTVKCRIGIDEHDDDEFLDRFLSENKKAGCKSFVVHARKAWLQGLSPKENRTKPPIDYDRVARMKQAHPELRIVVNGDIQTTDHVKEHLSRFDGIMIGREAYQNPWLLAALERELYSNDNLPEREWIARAMISYIEQQIHDYGTPVKSITRHMIGLFQGQPGAKSWRQALSTLPHENGADEYVIEEALKAMKNSH